MIKFTSYSSLPKAVRPCFGLITAAYYGLDEVVVFWLLRRQPDQEALRVTLLAAFAGGHEALFQQLLSEIDDAISEETCGQLGELFGEKLGEASHDHSGRNGCLKILVHSRADLSEKIRMVEAIAKSAPSGELKSFLCQLLASEMADLRPVHVTGLGWLKANRWS